MFISLGDTKLYATAFGSPSNRTILGIGGWIGSWELWAEPFSILSAGWRTLAYDHRGSGASVAPVESITFDRLVEDVFVVMDAFQVESCLLAAESAGAATALGAALRQPERISGLVLVDGMYFRDVPLDKDEFMRNLQANYPATLDWFVEACVPEPDSEHLRRWGRQILGRATQEAAIALLRASGSFDLRRELGRVTQPTLIIHGDRDAIVTLESSQWLAKTLPNARLCVISGAGHVPTVTRPAEIVRQIQAFFGA
jgi:pimeloyl-ACP methyl ester carboxylesterase